MGALQQLLGAVPGGHRERVRVGVEGERCGGGGPGQVGAEDGVGRLCSGYVSGCFSFVDMRGGGVGSQGADDVVGSYVLYTHMMRQRAKVMRGKEAARGR